MESRSFILKLSSPVVPQVINDILPKLAKKRVDGLMEFCQDAQFKLEITPTTTIEYVESLTFLDEIQEKVKASYFVFFQVILLSILVFLGWVGGELMLRIEWVRDTDQWMLCECE